MIHVHEVYFRIRGEYLTLRFPRRENIAKLEEISPRHMRENEDG